MGSSIHISVFPRSGAELGSMRPRRKQFEAISFRLEMERVVDDAMDGDQVDPNAIIGTATDMQMLPLSKGVTSLKKFDVWGCSKITDVGIAKVAAGQPSLRALCIARCTRVTDQGFLALLERCAAARAVDICGCTQITEASVTKIFGTCPKLRSLNLGGLKNIDESKFDLAPGSMQTLQALNLCGSSATDHVIDKIAFASPNILYLDLMGCRRLSDRGMESIATSLTQLQALNIQGARYVTDEGLCKVAQGCKLLRAVAAGNNSNITDGGVDALVRGNTLVHLDLRNCNKLTDKVLESLSKAGMEGLETLNLETSIVEQKEENVEDGGIYTPPAFTDRSLRTLFSGCAGLTGLSLAGRVVSFQSMQDLAKKCTSLQFLSLSKCEGLDADGFKAVCSGCSELSAINLAWCKNLDDEDALTVLQDVSADRPDMDSVLVLLPQGDETENPEVKMMKIRAAMGVPVQFQVQKLMQSSAELMMEKLWHWSSS